jgi:S1-C subfamily serine protease
VKNFSERDSVVAEMVQKVKPSMAAIYRYKKFNASAEDSLTEKDFLGAGAIVTNDGWILTASSVVASEKASYLIALDDRQVFPAQKVFRDVQLGVAFLKIEVNNLTVASFQPRRDLSPGQSTFLFGRNGNVFASVIKNPQFAAGKSINDLVRSSENFYKLILLQEAAPDEFVGGPAVTLDGQIFGIVKNKNGEIIPFEHFAEALKTQVKMEKWKQPYLGITFFDLSEVLNSLETMKNGVKIKAVKNDSPGSAVLMPQDIILKIENEELNAENNLPEILAAYKPNTTLKFTILRNGQELKLDVNLANNSD